jgi:hypothetical protein
MEMSGQSHAPAALPPEKEPQYPLDRRLVGLQIRSGQDGENSYRYTDLNTDSSVHQRVASRYTDCATADLAYDYAVT